MPVVLRTSITANRRVEIGSSVAKERLKTDAVLQPSRDSRTLALSSVGTRIASVWCRKNGRAAGENANQASASVIRIKAEVERGKGHASTVCSWPVNFEFGLVCSEYYCFLFGLSLSGSCFVSLIGSLKLGEVPENFQKDWNLTAVGFRRLVNLYKRCSQPAGRRDD
jgi:hypothetical protein